MIGTELSHVWPASVRAGVVEVDATFPGLSWDTYNGHDPSPGRAADGMVPNWSTAAGNWLASTLAT